jgi:hypothetical protein
MEAFTRIPYEQSIVRLPQAGKGYRLAGVRFILCTYLGVGSLIITTGLLARRVFW